jgi:Protein of unknown function (DUF4239)
MLFLWQDFIILIASLIAALLFMALLNHVWPYERRRVNNDLIGWQLSVVGTTYAVILGFMLYTVWTTYGAAQLNSDMEANALRNVYHLAGGLPEPQRTQLKQLSRDYAEAVITKDWPQMAEGQVPEGSHEISQAMVHVVEQAKLDSPTTGLYLDHELTALTTLSEYRRTRVLQVVYKLPAIFWAVLIVGAVVTILSAATFGASSPRLHAFQVTCLTLLLTLVLLAIADVNLPFQGWVHVDNYAFVRAQQYMND